MALVIPPFFGQLSFIYSGSIGTPEFVCTLGVSLVAVDETDYVDAANEAFGAWSTYIMAETESLLTLERVDLAVGLPGGGSGSVSSESPAVAGSKNGAHEPVSMAAVVQKLTNRLGRKGRGRNFLPGVLPDTDVYDTGLLEPTRQLDIQTAYTSLLDELASDGAGSVPMSPVLLHADGSAPTPIIGCRVSPQVGWLRGRIR